MDKTALLVIDVQAGMFSPSNPVHEGDALLSVLSALIARARAAGAPIVYIQHDSGPGTDLEYGTPGWEVHAPIAPRPGDIRIEKRTPDSFHQTSLQQELQALGVNKLILCGIQTEFCVDTTCRRAFSLGYDATLVSDGHSTWDSEHLTADQIRAHHNRVLRSFATVTASGDVAF
ncbi:MAG: cysteine hydrolase family protein [Symbiobacteriia bacterium]